MRSLDQLFVEYTTSETRSIKCAKCPQDALQVDTKLATLPRVLIVSINRFAAGQGKLTSEISMPLTLLMAPFTQHPASQKSYSLKAVIVHLGQSWTRGHYVSYILEADSKWRRYDDLNVEQVESPANVECHRNAYVYFYQLIDD